MEQFNLPLRDGRLSPYDRDMGDGVNIEKSQDLELKVISHRNESYRWFYNHYVELIINQRNYINLPTTVNKYKLEHFLRYGYDVILGLDATGTFRMLGYVKSRLTNSDPANMWNSSHLSARDIQFIVPDILIPHNTSELTQDNPTGTFIILRNKVLSLISDFETINMYAKKYAEIEASYYSLIIQSKVTTIFQSDINDDTTNQQIEAMYNGAPYLKLSSLMHPDRDILTVANDHFSNQIDAIKNAENDIISQLNNAIGIDGTGISKNSGVSDEEVHANDQIVNATGNIYINGIQEPLTLWNDTYGTKMFVYLNQVPTTDNKEDNTDENNS